MLKLKSNRIIGAILEVNNIDKLSTVELFKGLTRQDIANVATHCSIKSYAAEELIIQHREASTDVFFVVSGKVRAIIYSVNGKQVTFQDLAAGKMFGELSAIDGKPRATHIVALEKAEIGILKANIFLNLLQNHPSMAMATLQRLCGLTRRLCDRVFELSTLGVTNRIHAELLRLCRADVTDDNRAQITPIPTHAEIASRISTHREAVTRELNNLTKNKLIERQGGALVVNDIEKLSKMVEDVLGYQNGNLSSL